MDPQTPTVHSWGEDPNSRMRHGPWKDSRPLCYHLLHSVFRDRKSPNVRYLFLFYPFLSSQQKHSVDPASTPCQILSHQPLLKWLLYGQLVSTLTPLSLSELLRTSFSGSRSFSIVPISGTLPSLRPNKLVVVSESHWPHVTHSSPSRLFT